MISKTDYITYLKHPAWLWLRKHDPDFLPTPDDNSQAIIDEGREFEKLAEQIFLNTVSTTLPQIRALVRTSLSEASKMTT